MTTKQFANWLSTIEGITVISIEKDKVYFFITKEQLVVKVTKTANESDNFLSLHSDAIKMMFCLHNHKFEKFIELFEGKKFESSIPDLSLVTVEQMIDELKKRKNISFAFIMTEHTSVDNLSLEASGNPTFICGLLARATNLAAKYADKNINYYQTGEEIQDEEEEEDDSPY
jgi:hypothetical protein